jgi:hypothetical protein
LPSPELFQLTARYGIHAAARSVDFVGCSCGAVRRVNFDPLIVRPPTNSEAGAWYLVESPETIVLSEALRTIMVSVDEDLEFGAVRSEGPPNGGLGSR